MPDSVANFGDLLTGIGTLILAVIAIFGLKAWQEQLQGTTRHEIARKLALLAFQFEDHFGYARSRTVNWLDFADRSREPNETPALTQVRNDFYAKTQRGIKLLETVQQMRLVAWEAEILLGKDVKKYVDRLFELYKDYRFAVDMYFKYQLDYATRSQAISYPQGLPEEEKEWYMKVYDTGDKNVLTQAVQNTTNGLIQYLRQFI